MNGFWCILQILLLLFSSKYKNNQEQIRVCCALKNIKNNYVFLPVYSKQLSRAEKTNKYV